MIQINGTSHSTELAAVRPTFALTHYLELFDNRRPQKC